MVQDEQGNLFIPNILGGFEEEVQQVVYFAESETQGVQLIEYVNEQDGLFNESVVAVQDDSLER